MDWVSFSSRGKDVLQKYKYVILIILTGIVLLSLPSETPEKTVRTEDIPEVNTDMPMEESLAHILSMIEGAGRVEVLLSQAVGEEILYQTDNRESSGEHSRDIQKDTVLITDDNRTETGLIRQRNPPVYQGAVILCQGADKAGIRLSIVEAVMSITGLTSDKITVLKMK